MLIVPCEDGFDSCLGIGLGNWSLWSAFTVTDNEEPLAALGDAIVLCIENDLGRGFVPE